MKAVLLAEDNVYVRRNVRHVLLTRGHAVVEVGDGDRAIEVMTEHADMFDAVITDIAMPGADGIDVLRAARRMLPRALVIALTGFAEDERVRAAGFDLVLAKPTDLAALAQTIEDWRQDEQNRRSDEGEGSLHGASAEGLPSEPLGDGRSRGHR